MLASSPQVAARRALAGDRRRTAVAGGVGLALVVALLAVILTRSSVPIAYDNGQATTNTITLWPSQQACQRDEFVPAGAGRLRISLYTLAKAGVPVGFSVRAADGRALVESRARGAGGFSTVDFAVPPLARAAGNATVCVRDEGTSPVAVSASPPPINNTNPATPGRTPPPATVDGKGNRLPVRMGLLWRNTRAESWLATAPAIARRASYIRPAFFGAWTLWAAIAAAAIAAIAAMFALVRSVHR